METRVKSGFGLGGGEDTAAGFTRRKTDCIHSRRQLLSRQYSHWLYNELWTNRSRHLVNCYLTDKLTETINFISWHILHNL